MTDVVGCGCSMTMSGKRKGSRWWNDSRLVRCAFVLLLTLPASFALEDSAHVDAGTPVSFYWAEVNLTYRDPNTNKEVNESAKGKYGANSLVEQRTGNVVHVRNKENMTHGCDEYAVKLPQIPWIALVERGKCYFTDKITMATQTYNATAVVIYNHEDEGITIMQHSVKTQVSIFVSKKTGRKIAKLVDQGVSVTLTISPGKLQPAGGIGPHNSISKTSVLFVSISFIVLMIISLAWLVFYYIQRFRYAHAKERLARRLASAAKKAIAKIPQKTVKNGDRELDSEFDQCAVCIEVYKPHDVIRTLPCKHVFHKSCVDPWLLDQRSCPMCKLDILRAYGMQVLGSQESLHQDPESGNMAAPAEDREPSSTIDDQAAGDTEVKVLLLPHTCLHFPPDQDLAAGGATPGPSSQDDCRSLSCSTSIKNSSSADHLSHPVSPHHSEMQALMTAHRDVDEDDDEDEGFDERHRCTARLEDKVRGSEEEDGAGSLQMEQTRKSEERRKSKTLMDMLLEDC